jgi:cell wall-associated NlpC family hydrolase
LRPLLIRAALPVAAAALLTTGLVSASPASAAPQPTIAQVQAQLAQLAMNAANANEMLVGSNQRLTVLKQQMIITKAKIAAAQAAVTVGSDTADNLARDAYISGGAGGLAQILASGSLQQMLDRSTMLEAYSRSENNSVQSAAMARAQLAAQQLSLTQDLAIATDAANSAATEKLQVAADVKASNDLIASLKTQQIAALKAAALRVQQDQKVAAAAALANFIGVPAGSTPAVGSTPGVSSRAQLAVRYMLSQVGGIYSLNANPPATWDCSKLTAYAWAQAGVTLTPYSYSQWAETVRIPVSQLLPGDLLFFFRDGAHHVDMYIGNGMAVSASNPAVGVELQTNALTGWYGAHFSGAGRVVT